MADVSDIEDGLSFNPELDGRQHKRPPAPSLRPRPRAIRRPAPHAASPLEPQAQPSGTQPRTPEPRWSPEAQLLDDFVRPPQHRLRDRQPERLRGLEVDDQLEVRGLLDGQISGSGTL
jgi:hypothetical protein